MKRSKYLLSVFLFSYVSNSFAIIPLNLFSKPIIDFTRTAGPSIIKIAKNLPKIKGSPSTIVNIARKFPAKTAVVLTLGAKTLESVSPNKEEIANKLIEKLKEYGSLLEVKETDTYYEKTAKEQLKSYVGGKLIDAGRDFLREKWDQYRGNMPEKTKEEQQLDRIETQLEKLYKQHDEK